MKSRFPRLLTFIAAAVLVLAVGLAIVPRIGFERPQVIQKPLESLLPADVEGWETRRLEIAESPEMRSRAMSILRFDDVLYRSYRHGSIEVQVYVAYWKPGTVPYGQAGVHTPDTCWVATGWKQEERQYSQALKSGGRVTKPSETGRFSLREVKLDVVFWHLVGGRVHTYLQYGWLDGMAGVRERLPHLFQDLRRYGLNLAQGQLFVRVSSNVSLEKLLRDPAFERLFKTLAPLGIFES